MQTETGLHGRPRQLDHATTGEKEKRHEASPRVTTGPEGRPESFEAYFAARGRWVLLARHLLASSADAEDVVQEVLARIAARWEHHRRMTNLDGYVWRSVVNECRSRQRRPWWRRELPSAPSDLPDAPALPGDDRADWQEVLELLRSLSPNQRAVLVLRYFEGLSDPEVADVLRMSVKTVSSHASRALKTLRAELGSAGVSGVTPSRATDPGEVP